MLRFDTRHSRMLNSWCIRIHGRNEDACLLQLFEDTIILLPGYENKVDVYIYIYEWINHNVWTKENENAKRTIGSHLRFRRSIIGYARPAMLARGGELERRICREFGSLRWRIGLSSQEECVLKLCRILRLPVVYWTPILNISREIVAQISNSCAAFFWKSSRASSSFRFSRSIEKKRKVNQICWITDPSIRINED